MPKVNQTKQQVFSNEFVASIEKQLTTILESPHFKSAKKMQKFLQYIVYGCLEGKGNQLKQYTIAIEALDLPEDFDPDTNPTVRILAGRVRDRLEKYYNEEGVKDNIVIRVEKGSYSPIFEERKITSSFLKNKNKKSSKLSKLKYVAITVVLFGIFGLSYFLINQFMIKDKESFHTVPLVDVMPFENLSNISRGRIIAKGIRYQLLSELSQFKTIRVRDVSDDIKQNLKGKTVARYRIKGGLMANNDELQITIFLEDVSLGEILWTKKVITPATDAGFNKLIFESIKGVISKITAPSGVMQINAMKKLRDRLEQDKGGITSSYECVLLFYEYDNTKEPSIEDEVRKCQKYYTGENIKNSSLWATNGLMLLLDWTKRKDKTDDSLYEQSLASFKKAISIDPYNAQAYEYYGNYYMVKERNDEAMIAYLKAMELNPSKPDIHVSIGWMKVNKGDWEGGIKEIREGIKMSYKPPGWFHIPLAVNAFREKDYKAALEEAEKLVSAGDNRGIALALAAAVKLDRNDLVKRYLKQYKDYRKDDLAEPLREVGSVLKTPKVLEEYTNTLTPIIESLKRL